MSDLNGLPLFQTPKPKERESADGAPQPKRSIWSVQALTERIRGVLHEELGEVWLKGEVSNFKIAASGHAYFSLKDSQAQISAVMFGLGRKRLPFDVKDGLEVLVRGKVSVYAPRGSYQLILDQIEPVGAGALQLAFEQLKSKLEALGWFDSNRKKSLPSFPKRIAIVTSPSGAAVQDFLNLFQRRAPFVPLVIVPTRVQGKGAEKEIALALRRAQEIEDVDLIVLTRGGGSLEDLWCFNEEVLARAIFEASVPVVSAVGHEVDFTIADFVADVRAPTPSAAAEVVSEGWMRLEAFASEAQKRLHRSMLTLLSRLTRELGIVQKQLKDPRVRLEEQSQRVDDLTQRLQKSIQLTLKDRMSRLRFTLERLEALSPLRVLERGFTMVTDGENPSQLIRSVKEIWPGKELRIHFSDGNQKVKVL